MAILVDIKPAWEAWCHVGWFTKSCRLGDVRYVVCVHSRHPEIMCEYMIFYMNFA
jgi:hypothetical protein